MVLSLVSPQVYVKASQHPKRLLRLAGNGLINPCRARSHLEPVREPALILYKDESSQASGWKAMHW